MEANANVLLLVPDRSPDEPRIEPPALVPELAPNAGSPSYRLALVIRVVLAHPDLQNYTPMLRKVIMGTLPLIKMQFGQEVTHMLKCLLHIPPLSVSELEEALSLGTVTEKQVQDGANALRYLADLLAGHSAG